MEQGISHNWERFGVFARITHTHTRTQMEISPRDATPPVLGGGGGRNIFNYVCN